MSPKKLWLPGAGGAGSFWDPLIGRMPASWSNQAFSWPGLGDQPAVAGVDSIEDLIERVLEGIDEPVDLIAQSMGGVVASRIAIEHPARVRRLVLIATSAGVNMAAHGAENWRRSYRERFPKASPWITEARAAADVPLDRIACPTLLIWGDADPISPVAVGQELHRRIAGSRLEVVVGGDHDLASLRSAEVSLWLQPFLS